MSTPRAELPTIQNWSCHQCGSCCRHHAIEVTEAERKRIDAQGWAAAEGMPIGKPIFIPLGKPKGKLLYRLAHQSDGACVFLDAKGLCKIHGKFGEDAKPLACRIYPYALHPAGKKVVVSLRFSCPSAVANRGRPVSQQAAEIRKIAAAIVPDGAEKIPPPPLLAKSRPEWRDLLRFVERLDATLAEPNATITVKLLRALFWANLIAKARFDNIAGADLDEILHVLAESAKEKVSGDFTAFPAPSRSGRMLFRSLIVQYARLDTVLEAESVWRYRWKLLRAAAAFSTGIGNAPPLQACFKATPFSAIEQPFGGLPDKAEEMLTRYFRVKIQGIHFCGAAYYHFPLLEGFQSLVLMYPVILWLARWLAAVDGRRTLELDDVACAISVADHHFGYSPALGSPITRLRIRILSRFDDLGKLCVWYAR